MDKQMFLVTTGDPRDCSNNQRFVLGEEEAEKIALTWATVGRRVRVYKLQLIGEAATPAAVFTHVLQEVP